MNAPENKLPLKAPVWIGIMPPVFVLLWSTGFIFSKLGQVYVEPFTFMVLRFAIASIAIVLIALIWRAPWPRTFAEYRDAIVVGILLHGIYLGGVFLAISLGTGAGITSVITGLQPILTAAFAIPFLGEHITRRQTIGLGLGFSGLVLVVWTGQGAGPWTGIAASLAALVSITIATLYQKRYAGSRDIRTSSAIQLIAALIFSCILAFTFETREIIWSNEFIFALLWLAIPMSVGTFTLYHLMIRWGAVAKVTSVFYMVPPVVVIESYFLFGEKLNLRQGLGIVFATLGVAMVTARRKS